MSKKPVRCPVCSEHNLTACPECSGTGKAICHRCQMPIMKGDWVATESLGITGGKPIRVFFCRQCADDIGIAVGPRLKLVA